MHSQQVFPAPPEQSALAVLLTKYREFALVALGGLIGVAGTVASFYMQRSHDLRMAEAARIEAHVAQAVQALQEIGGALDAVTVASSLVAEAALDSSPSADLTMAAGAVSEARTEWLRRRNRARLLAAVYFGDSVEAEVQLADKLVLRLDVHIRQLRESQSFLRSMSARERSSEDGRRALAHDRELRRLISAELASWSSATYLLERAMAAFIQARAVGSFDPLADLSRTVKLRPTPWPSDSEAAGASR